MQGGPGVTITTSSSSFEVATDCTVPEGSIESLVIDSPAGSIDVQPCGSGPVTVHAVMRGPDEAAVNTIELTTMRTPAGVLKVEWTRPPEVQNVSVSFTVRVPEASLLDLRTGAGSVEVGAFESGATVDTGAGSVTVRGTKGGLAVTTGAGSVRLLDVDGVVNVESGAGSLDVDGRLSGSSRVITHAGSVQVSLPADASLKVDGTTDAGSASSDFPSVTVTGKYADKTLSGTLGDGSGGTLHLETSAGSLDLKRR